MGRYNNLLRQPEPITPTPSEATVTEETQAPSQPEAATAVSAETPASQAIFHQVDNQARELSSYHDSLIASIRKAVKVLGKEVSFVRMTPIEKRQLADIVYTYKRLGIKTSENEINRIAINFLLEDYQANGADSVLAKVIEALQA